MLFAPISQGASSSDGGALCSYAERRKFDPHAARPLFCPARYHTSFNSIHARVSRRAFCKCFVELHLRREIKHVRTVRPIYGNRLLFRRPRDVKIETQTLRNTRRAFV